MDWRPAWFRSLNPFVMVWLFVRASVKHSVLHSTVVLKIFVRSISRTREVLEGLPDYRQRQSQSCRLSMLWDQSETASWWWWRNDTGSDIHDQQPVAEFWSHSTFAHLSASQRQLHEHSVGRGVYWTSKFPMYRRSPSLGEWPDLSVTRAANVRLCEAQLSVCLHSSI